MKHFSEYIFISIISLFVFYFTLQVLLKKLGKNPHNILPRNFAHRVKYPLIILLLAIALHLGLIREKIFTNESQIIFFQQIKTLLLILSFTWFIIVGIRIGKKLILKGFDVKSSNNLRARKFYTQFNILERILVGLVIIFSLGIAFLTFDGVKEIGLSLLTSAGIAGIILGFSAQKGISTLLAGIQIALTQPIRIDDVVIVKGEWGRIEEIRLTYVVVKIWDKRRLVVPTTYFIETPFENWTRNSSDILASVYLYTDYNLPLNELRKEFNRLLNTTDLWDKQVNVIQITDATEKTVEIRALMSASDSSRAWDLRVFIREKLLEFIQTNFPESLPVARIEPTKFHHPE